jgi:hypothetical protein
MYSESGFREASREPRPLDLAVISGVRVDDVEFPDDVEEMARLYCDDLERQGVATTAEVAWAFRRQLQEDLRQLQEDLRQLIREDESLALSLAIYRRLLKTSQSKLLKELERHAQEKKAINGTYKEFKTTEKSLNTKRTKLNELLAEMFKRAGQEPKPVHIAKRAVLESCIADLEQELSGFKANSSNVAALIEYDTIREYARQLRGNGFVWTKSRHKLLRDVLTGALTSRPVAALMGETGTGKTALARAASIELTSNEPERTVGGDQEKFVRLLASPAISAEKGTSYDFGPLLRAMTGLSSSTDNPNNSRGGGIFFDDEFNTRPTSIQRQILKFVSEARPGRKVAVPGTPLTVEVQPGFLYLAAGNPPSERYDREETGIETKREFAGNVLNVEYLEQTPENPELYHLLLAGLMDESTGRITAVGKDEVSPSWTLDKTTGISTLSKDSDSGAFLWRFSQAWGELFKAFSKQDTILHTQHPTAQKKEYFLKTFILDPGVVLSWIDQYKADPTARKGHIAKFLKTKLKTYISQFPQDEQTLVYTYLNLFGLKDDKAKEKTKPKFTTLTPQDIGYLSPNVPKPKEKPAPSTFTGKDVIDPESGDATGIEDFEKDKEPNQPTPGELAPFAYDKAKAKEYGFSELQVEAHPKAQAIVEAIRKKEPRFVTIHKAGSPDPDSTTTPQAILTKDKPKLNLAALKAAWKSDCANLPDVPQRSTWYFQALAENRLATTIDGDNTTTIGTPSIPFIPRFGTKSFLLAMDFKEFDYNDAQEKQASITTQTKKILKHLFNTEDPTNLKRNDINTALWKDHEKRIQSDTAKAIVAELLPPTENPNNYELRLLTPDEYERAAKTQGYGNKNLWTHFDGYYQHDDGHRIGLDGGPRDYGGAAYVGNVARGSRYDFLAVRVVLSRK